MDTEGCSSQNSKNSSPRRQTPERRVGAGKLPRAIPGSFEQGIEKGLVASVIRFVCHNCGGPVFEVKKFRTLPRVTSDCRPWPSGGRVGNCRSCGLVQTRVSPQWRKECTRIYSTYRIYRQSGGKEQAVFGNGAGEPRSVRIVRGLRSIYRLPHRGNLLDVGCGNGGFLRAFHEKYASWRLYGTEFDRRNEQILKRIHGFARLFCGSKQPPRGYFDLISLVHVLEHLEHPSRFLRNLVDLARPGAKFLIEVPNAEANPFILPVADHVSHFDRRSLRHVAENAGLKVQYLTATLVPRELTAVASAEKKIINRGKKISKKNKWVKNNIYQLARFSEKAQKEGKEKKLIVFGSSLGAGWLYGACRGQIKFFMDEDKNRIGRKHLGIPIKSLQQQHKLKKQKNLYVPMKNQKVNIFLRSQGYNVISLD